MSEWGRQTYGDPCRECGFEWNIAASDARSLVGGVPSRLSLVETDGFERHPDLDWPVVAYVAHMADNLRIWAERIISAGSNQRIEIVSYDANGLASARRYDSLPLLGTMWSLDWAARSWTEAVGAASFDSAMAHPVRGEISLDDVMLTNAHDVAHHEWDIQRILSFEGMG